MTKDRFNEYKTRHTIRKGLSPNEIDECLDDYFQLKMPVDDLVELIDEVRNDAASLTETLKKPIT